MNILVINGHPDKKSFSAAIFNKVIDNLDNEKHEIETLNLAEMKFDPVLRFGYRERMVEDTEITRSQELIQWADHLIFIYPIWWSSMPSLMKGWIDRVFTPGVAVLKNAVLNHCGIKTRKVMNLGDMNREPNTLEVRERFLEKVAKHASKI